MVGRTLVLKTAALPPVRKLVRDSALFRPLVRRFIAGDTLEQALEVSESILARGMRVSLDYLGENTFSKEEALQAKSTYIRMLHTIGGRPLQNGIEPLNISIKLTQCGLDISEEFAEENLREVVRVAAEFENFVRVDMEASEYTERTIRLMSRVIPDLQNTGTVLQSYLFRTDADLDTLLALNARIRLVKGAYLEPASVAYPEKSKVDEAYVRQAKKLLTHGRYPAIATQDEAIIRELNGFIASQAIDRTSFEYQMLFGVRRDLQESLAREGYNVRVYVPFGDAWYPYFTRRLAERPANAGFILKSLLKG